ncbi:MAG: hypothetical protein WKF55_15940 [Gemmatimonadaceae bacterium]
MAEIPIQKKAGGSMLPWLLGALLLAAVLWFLFGRGGDNVEPLVTDIGPAPTVGPVTGDSATAGPVEDAAGSPAAVQEFATFVAATDANRDEAAQHAYSAGGIRRLADALDALDGNGDQNSAALANMRKQADALQDKSAGSGHAAMTRSAFASAVDIFAGRERSNPAESTNAAKVRSAASNLKTDRDLLAQKATIQSFFEAARNALQAARSTT